MKFKDILIFIFKIALAAAIIFWMIKTDKLDFSKLSLLNTNKELILYVLSIWLFFYVILGSFRWYLLLRGVGICADYLRVLTLHLIGLFFNSAMPGAVGGDLIKGYYVIKDNSVHSKTPAALSILLDRIAGIMGLFVLGMLSVILNFKSFWNNDLLKPIVILIIILFLSTIVFFIIVFIPIKDENNLILKITSINIYGVGLIKKIYLALRAYKQKPWCLINAFLLSIIIQSAAMFVYIEITQKLNHVSINIFEYAAIFPIGVLTTAIPITPGGLGVGHVAFEKLYELINLKNGANVFNIFFLINIILNCIGVIPYVLLKPNKMNHKHNTVQH